MTGNPQEGGYSYDPEKSESFYCRLKEATRCGNIVKLSKYFDVSQADISDWKRRTQIPLHQQGYLMSKGVNPEWIYSGKGEKSFPCACSSIEGNRAGKILCPLKASLLQMLTACEDCSAWADLYKAKESRWSEHL